MLKVKARLAKGFSLKEGDTANIITGTLVVNTKVKGDLSAMAVEASSIGLLVIDVVHAYVDGMTEKGLRLLINGKKLKPLVLEVAMKAYEGIKQRCEQEIELIEREMSDGLAVLDRGSDEK